MNAVGLVSAFDREMLRRVLGAAVSPATLQGFSYIKPHGYPGDFQIIDHIYQSHVSEDARFESWDRCFQSTPAAQAVRNRKVYFHRLLDQHCARRKPLRVLKIASGPGRSMFEWLKSHPETEIEITCVEVDPLAIDHAQQLNEPFARKITFVQANALRYASSSNYDLIWAAGICDYFSDALFLRLLRRLLPRIAEGGEAVIGSFTDPNPSRPYMELIGEWRLFHRSRDSLRALAIKAGATSETIQVDPSLLASICSFESGLSHAEPNFSPTGRTAELLP